MLKTDVDNFLKSTKFATVTNKVFNMDFQVYKNFLIVKTINTLARGDK